MRLALAALFGAVIVALVTVGFLAVSSAQPASSAPPVARKPATGAPAAQPATPTPAPRAAQAGPGDPAAGKALTTSKGCIACHKYDPSQTAEIGPPLFDIGNVAATRKPGLGAADYIRESILDPGAFLVPGYQPTMPSFRGQLSDQELNDLIAYYLTLRR